jgi:hypothetical protein
MTTVFEDCDPPATDEAIRAIEERVGHALPAPLVKLFREANGGRPVPDTYDDPRVFTDVSECRPAGERRGNVLDTYELMVVAKQAAPRHFVPFANDSGGNLFFVDVTTEDAQVYFLTHDPAFRLHRLGIGLETLWESLVDLDTARARRGAA